MNWLRKLLRKTNGEPDLGPAETPEQAYRRLEAERAEAEREYLDFRRAHFVSVDGVNVQPIAEDSVEGARLFVELERRFRTLCEATERSQRAYRDWHAQKTGASFRA